MAEADVQFHSVDVADSHIIVSPEPQKSNKVRKRFSEAQTPIFILVSLALLCLTIEAYFINRLYRLMPAVTGEDGPSCKKPFAHIDNQDSNRLVGTSDTCNMLYIDGGLVVQKTGFYFVYSKVTLKENMLFEHGKCVCVKLRTFEVVMERKCFDRMLWLHLARLPDLPLKSKPDNLQTVIFHSRATTKGVSVSVFWTLFFLVSFNHQTKKAFLPRSQFVTLTFHDTYFAQRLEDICAAGMAEADVQFHSVDVADSHIIVSPEPQKSNKVRQCFRAARTPIFILVCLVLLCLTIEAYINRRLYRPVPAFTTQTPKTTPDGPSCKPFAHLGKITICV
ncbi:tumor necrosis factor ligand superfamily member 14-like [Scomber scombrus]|uniref:Tumor necrosis factor ligand superfamily member 14-like n=1 Tax=Scomber scombrus TaxID=13677 RepID=A0AAV1PVU3_SCOSC